MIREKTRHKNVQNKNKQFSHEMYHMWKKIRSVIWHLRDQKKTKKNQNKNDENDETVFYFHKHTQFENELRVWGKKIKIHFHEIETQSWQYASKCFEKNEK